MAPMIVHVGNYDPNALDGVSTTVVGQCDALLKLGVSIEVWNFVCGIKEIERKAEESGVVVYRIPRFRNPLLAALRLPRVSSEWVRNRLPEVSTFHLHSVFSPQNNRVSRFGVPYVVTPNGGWGQQVIHGRNALFKAAWIKFFERRLWARAKFVQAVSEPEFKDLVNLPEMTRVVHVSNGVSVSEVPTSSCGEVKRDHWMFLGRLAIEQKGLDTLLLAYARIKQAPAPLPPLLLAGPDFRGGMEELRSLAKDLGISSKVEFTGPVTGPKKDQVWCRASVFLHPSRWEGLPLTILEALAHGVPCLVTPETGMADWIVENRCGWTVDGSVESLAACLSKLAKDPDLIAECASNTRPTVARDFSWNSIGEKLIASYGGFDAGN